MEKIRCSHEAPEGKQCKIAVLANDPHGTCLRHSPCWVDFVFHPEYCTACRSLFTMGSPQWQERMRRMKNSVAKQTDKVFSWSSRDVAVLYQRSDEEAKKQVEETPI